MLSFLLLTGPEPSHRLVRREMPWRRTETAKERVVRIRRTARTPI